MKVLRIILIIIVVLFAGFCIWMYTLPSTYYVERSKAMKASPKTVFEQVADVKRWEAWSPWHSMDSTMAITYGDTTQGTGATYSWTSEEMGDGSFSITKTVPYDSIHTQLKFKEMGSSDGLWTFEEMESDSTNVSWSMTGDLGFFERFFGIIIEKQSGSMFEKGLDSLSAIAEKQAAMQPMAEIEEVQTSAQKYFGIIDTLAISDLNSDFFANRYEKIGNYLQKDMQNMTGAPIAIYHKWDQQKGETVVETAMPVNSDKEGSTEIKTGKTYEGTALKAVHKGAYAETGKTHNAIEKHIKQNGYLKAGSPWEAYVNDPSKLDTSQWETAIYYPVEMK